MTRRALVAAMLVSALAVTGCGLPQAESALEPSEVANRVERSLGVELAERDKVDINAVFHDVEATYVGETSTERMLIIVFRRSNATAQVLGRNPPRLRGLEALRHRNVVVLYTHVPGAANRADRVAAALRTIGSTG